MVTDDWRGLALIVFVGIAVGYYVVVPILRLAELLPNGTNW